MKFNAVIFDLDGTLLDTIEDITDSTNKVLGRFGFPLHTADEYKIFVGDGVSNLLMRALPEDHRDMPTVKACIALLVFEEFRKRKKSRTKAYDGVPELLSALVEQKIKTAIFSNRPLDSAELLVRMHLSSWPLKPVVGAGSKFPNKPSPEGALNIAQLLKTCPEKIIFLGDSDVDMQAAVAARMYPVGALWGFRKAKELKANGARALIRRPQDLLKFFT